MLMRSNVANNDNSITCPLASQFFDKKAEHEEQHWLKLVFRAMTHHRDNPNVQVLPIPVTVHQTSNTKIAIFSIQNVFHRIDVKCSKMIYNCVGKLVSYFGK